MVAPKKKKCRINACLTSLLKKVKMLILVQISFHFILPYVDTFLDLGQGFHSVVHTLYQHEYHHPSYHHQPPAVDISRLKLFNEVHDSDISSTTISITNTTNICVPGAGFSGFWFSLGRLHALEQSSLPYLASQQYLYTEHNPIVQLHDAINDTFHDPAYQNGFTDNRIRMKPYYSYTCFSAGCLGATIAIFNISKEVIIDIAADAQELWQGGVIGRYHVVEYFIDEILALDTIGRSHPIKLKESLGRIHVLTTTREKIFLRKRSPESLLELKEFLMQTTWIPYVTGNSLWRRDESRGDYHMDGAFNVHSHPRCTHKLGLPLRIDLWSYILSPSLHREKALEFYNLGYQYDDMKE